MYIVTEKIEYIYQLLRNFEYWKVIRITSWSYRFLENCKRNEKFSDSVKTSETEKAKVFRIKHEQRQTETTDNFKEDQRWLTLCTRVYKCWERVKDHYPVYIPPILLAKKITHEADKRTMREEVIMAIAAIGENY